MESNGKVIAVLGLRQGTSARTGNAWATQSFVIETQEQYPRKQCFEIFGADNIQKFLAIAQIGAVVNVSADYESREFTRQDGTTTWFNSARAWNVTSATQAPVQPTPAPAPAFNPMPSAPAFTAPAPTSAPAAPEGGEDLPF